MFLRGRWGLRLTLWTPPLPLPSFPEAWKQDNCVPADRGKSSCSGAPRSPEFSCPGLPIHSGKMAHLQLTANIRIFSVSTLPPISGPKWFRCELSALPGLLRAWSPSQSVSSQEKPSGAWAVPELGRCAPTSSLKPPVVGLLSIHGSACPQSSPSQFLLRLDSHLSPLPNKVLTAFI